MACKRKDVKGRDANGPIPKGLAPQRFTSGSCKVAILQRHTLSDMPKKATPKSVLISTAKKTVVPMANATVVPTQKTTVAAKTTVVVPAPKKTIGEKTQAINATKRAPIIIPRATGAISRAENDKTSRNKRKSTDDSLRTPPTRVAHKKPKTDTSRNAAPAPSSQDEKWWKENARVQVVDEADGQHSFFIHVPGYLQHHESQRKAIHGILDEQKWPSKRRAGMMGNVMPRDIVWHQKCGKPYVFSRRRFDALEKWSPALETVCQHLVTDLNKHTKPLQTKYPNSFLPVAVDSVLINRYVDCSDSVSAHSDNEPLFGKNPTIVSISAGHTRTFKIARKSPAVFKKDRRWSHVPPEVPAPTESKTYTFQLADGDLLIMAGAAQDYWAHRLEKEEVSVPTQPSTTADSTASDSTQHVLNSAKSASTRWNMTWRAVVT